MASIDDFDFRSEQYYLHVGPGVEVLATTPVSGHVPWRQGVHLPVVYKTRYGQRRVFYSALGHTVEEFDRSKPRTMLSRGLAWAGRS